MPFDGLVWLLILLGPFLFFQRQLHRHLQIVLLLITRRLDLTIAVFSLLFLPGVILHETSHYVMARLLRVSTGKFSIVPRSMPGGRLQLGFVETEEVDFLRDALIGLAPLLTGGLMVTYIGLVRLHFDQVWVALTQADWQGVVRVSANLPGVPDFWFWFYLAFAVSSTMLPSSSDRRAWQPLLLAVAVLIVLAWIAGAGPWMLIHAAPVFNQAMRALAIALGISLVLHIVLLPPVWGAELLLNRAAGIGRKEA